MNLKAQKTILLSLHYVLVPSVSSLAQPDIGRSDKEGKVGRFRRYLHIRRPKYHQLSWKDKQNIWYQGNSCTVVYQILLWHIGGSANWIHLVVVKVRRHFGLQTSIGEGEGQMYRWVTERGAEAHRGSKDRGNRYQSYEWCRYHPRQ